MIDSDLLLPDPSILEKLERHAPGSANAILNLAEDFAAQRRAAEVAKPRLLGESLQSVWKGIQKAMAIYPMPLGLSAPPPQAYAAYMAENFARTGDSMRLAIVRYMKEKGITGEDLSLTPQEISSLELISPISGPKGLRRGPNV